jgi:hypothetical protein
MYIFPRYLNFSFRDTLLLLGRAVELATKLVSNPAVRLAGLGPRDSLRIEAGLCLYGQEIDENISPIAAGLAWCIGAILVPPDCPVLSVSRYMHALLYGLTCSRS